MLEHILPDPRPRWSHTPEDQGCPYRNWFQILEPIPPVVGGTWGLLIASDGHPQIRWLCGGCGRLSTQSLSHRRAWEFDLEIAELPVLADRQAGQR